MKKEVEEKEKQEAEVCQGSVVFYNSGRGFGFIKREGKGDVFFHHTGLLDNYSYPQQNDLVTFEVAEGREGKEKAVNVQRIKAEQPQVEEEKGPEEETADK